MRITLLPSSFATESHRQYLTTFLINETIAVDAGSLGLNGSPQTQMKIRHIFISHTHMDHIASLPMFLENVYGSHREAVTLYGSDAVVNCLIQDVFNGRIWPNFITTGNAASSPFLNICRLKPYESINIEDLTITPVPVDHVVPTLGFIFEDSQASVVITSDTGPTEAIWKVAGQRRNLKAVFLEASFPKVFDQLAESTLHLTTEGFLTEVKKIPRGTRLLAVHLKPRFFDVISAELAALDINDLEICQPGQCYDF